MKLLKRWLHGIRREEEGATIVEYALLAALISVAAVVALTAMGTEVSTLFNTIKAKIAG